MRIVRTSMATADVVREAQRVLRDLGYYAGPLDGILGPEERRAIWNFQKARSLTRSGSLDARTVIALGIAPVEIAAAPETFSYALPGERPAQIFDVQAP